MPSELPNILQDSAQVPLFLRCFLISQLGILWACKLESESCKDKDVYQLHFVLDRKVTQAMIKLKRSSFHTLSYFILTRNLWGRFIIIIPFYKNENLYQRAYITCLKYQLIDKWWTRIWTQMWMNPKHTLFPPYCIPDTTNYSSLMPCIFMYVISEYV